MSETMAGIKLAMKRHRESGHCDAHVTGSCEGPSEEEFAHAERDVARGVQVHPNQEDAK